MAQDSEQSRSKAPRIQPPKMVRINIMLDAETDNALFNLAFKLGLSKSELIRNMIRKELQEMNAESNTTEQ